MRRGRGSGDGLTDPDDLDGDKMETGAARLVVGCAGLPVQRQAYGGMLSAIELREAQAQPPGAKAARSWREELGACAVALPAWQLVCGEPVGTGFRGVQKAIEPGHLGRYGAFHDTQEVRDAFGATRVAADALNARVIVFNCGASFTPTVENEARMRKFFESTPRDGRTFALSLRGVWEASRVSELAHAMDVVPVTDPLDDEAPTVDGPFAYFQLPGPVMGRYRYNDDDLDALRARCDDFDEAWCICAGPAMWAEARSFTKRV